MQLHTFTARSLPEALRIVRRELGNDASVLHTREVGSALARCFFGRTIEVTASAEVNAPRRLRASEVKHDPLVAQRLNSAGVTAERVRIPPAELEDFRRQMRESLAAAAPVEPSLVEQLAAGTRRGMPARFPHLAAIERRLRLAGVRDEWQARWLARLQAELACDPDSHADRTLERLKHIVAADLPVRGGIDRSPQGPTVVALVGPTGVGKTTTLAKLAAHFRWRQGNRVALLSADTCRIAAVEQLRTYAEIMDLPMEVVATPSEMAAASCRLSQHDIVLIDTAGHSPSDAAGLLQLQALLSAARPHETLLALSCVAGARSWQNASAAFRGIGATSLILTKLDESPCFAQLAECLAACRLPVSYTTHGQNVPDDIQPASALRLAELILADGRNAIADVPCGSVAPVSLTSVP